MGNWVDQPPPVWRTRAELFAVLQQYRVWAAHGGDPLVSQLIRLQFIQPREPFYFAMRAARAHRPPSPTTHPKKPG